MARTTRWTDEQDVSHDAVLAHHPTGHAWVGLITAGKVMYGLVKAISEMFEDAWTFLCDLADELDYRTTTQMLVEWEEAVSIPDPCLPVGARVEERRQWIAFRLDKKRWNTLQDWYDLAALFGVSVRITPGWLVQRPALFDAYFPKPFHQFPKLGRFRVYIDILDQEFGGFPYDGTSLPDHQFPIPFGARTEYVGAFRCMIERVAPANVLIIWNEFPTTPPNGNGVTFTDDFTEEFA